MISAYCGLKRTTPIWFTDDLIKNIFRIRLKEENLRLIYLTIRPLIVHYVLNPINIEFNYSDTLNLEFKPYKTKNLLRII